MPQDTFQLAEQLGERLLAVGKRVTAAESCTGGGVAQAITAVAGSSQWFDLGLVTYSNTAKQQFLGVPEELLLREGAVSEAVVLAMAVGAIAASGADFAVAVSGIAGPDGGTAEKPVGNVWFAWAGPAGVQAEKHQLSGGRAEVRDQAVKISLRGLLQRVTECTTV